MDGERYLPNFKCWGYDFVSKSLPSECEAESLTLNKRVEFCREKLNEIYRNYTRNKDWNETEFLTYLGKACGLGLTETVYLNLKDIIPSESCKNSRTFMYYPVNYEEVDKMLLTSEILAFYTIKTYFFTTLEREFFSLCENITNSEECANKLMDKLEIISKNVSFQIPPYEEIKLPKCPQTITYIHLKDLEKEIRNQLNKTEDPISQIIKTLEIRVYSDCAKEFYKKVIENTSCPIIPMLKTKSFEIVTKNHNIAAYCYSKSLQNYLGEINRTTNTLTILNFTIELI